MWFKHRAWLPIAWLLSLANLVAVWFAAQPGEPLHATVHALFAVAFGVGAQRLGQRKEPTADGDVMRMLQGLEARLANPDPHQVVQALDAMAVEVERIGEGQRFLTKLLTERDARLAAGAVTPPVPDAVRSPVPPIG